MLWHKSILMWRCQLVQRRRINSLKYVPMITLFPTDVRFSFSGRSYCSPPRGKDYYDILKISPRASQTQVKSSYYRLSKKYHPDINTSPEGRLNFNRISEAYETIGNTRLRSEYDRSLFRSNVGVQYQGSAPHKAKVRRFTGRSTPPMGRTKIYDFDEYYRQHYGAFREAQLQQRQKYDELLKQDSEREKSHNAIINTFYVIAVVGFAFMLSNQYDRHKKVT